MDIEEALETLQLTSKNCNLSIARKNYLALLRKYHPDNKNNLSLEEKLSKSQKLTIAYEIIKGRQEREVAKDSVNTLEENYAIELQLPNLSLDLLPRKISNTINEYYKKYLNLYKYEKIKSYNSVFDMKFGLEIYQEKYEKYRKELTYYLFNYLQASVQKKFGEKSPLYYEIDWEYCAKYDSHLPFILPSLYEIVQKFICFFPIFVEEMKKIKEYLKVQVMDIINKKIKECQKLEYYSYIKVEVDDILNYTLERVDLLFDVAPEEKIDSTEMDRILRSFEELVTGILERYEYFVLEKDSLIGNLENGINREIEDSNRKMNLLLELLPLYEELNMEKFYHQIDRIKEVLPSHLETMESVDTKNLFLKREPEIGPEKKQ